MELRSCCGIAVVGQTYVARRGQASSQSLWLDQRRYVAGGKGRKCPRCAECKDGGRKLICGGQV